MRLAESDKIFTVEEYIKEELISERRHEFVNGQLFEMPGEKDINNIIAGIVYVFFMTHMRSRGYDVYINDIKVAIPGGDKYYYPDVFITKEKKAESNRYIKYKPEVIVEVVSESSQVKDYVDKYLEYTKIPSLLYYLIIEPETTLITVYSKDETNNWLAQKYTSVTDIVKLSKMHIEIPVKEIYSK